MLEISLKFLPDWQIFFKYAKKKAAYRIWKNGLTKYEKPFFLQSKK